VENVKGNPIFLMLAYPIPDITMILPDSSAIKRWWSHVNKIKESGFQKTVESSICLEEGVECKIYIFMRGYPSRWFLPEEPRKPLEKLGLNKTEINHSKETLTSFRDSYTHITT